MAEVDRATMSVTSKVTPSNDSRVISTCSVLCLLFSLACPLRFNLHWGLSPSLGVEVRVGGWGGICFFFIWLLFLYLSSERIMGLRGSSVCVASISLFLAGAKEGEGQPGIQHGFLSDPEWVGILIPPRLSDFHHCGRSPWVIGSNWLMEASIVREPSSELSSQGAKQNTALNCRTEGELQSSAFFPLNQVSPASRWTDVPYRASVIGSQPVLCISHSWHQDKLIFLLNWPLLLSFS